MLLSLIFCLASCIAEPAKSVEGGWISRENGTIQIAWIFSDGFFSASRFDPVQKTFTGTWGGSYRMDGKKISFTEEFNTITPAQIGATYDMLLTSGKSTLTFSSADGTQFELTRSDDGKPGALAGAWWITGRLADGQMRTVTPGARRTMKILSGTRFQWIAYNVDTREFFGTGGGTYTTIDGKYTETLEFFSRDNNRVGASLQFDFSIENGRWRHRGLSSKGEAIDEFWSHRNDGAAGR